MSVFNGRVELSKEERRQQRDEQGMVLTGNWSEGKSNQSCGKYILEFTSWLNSKAPK